MADLSTTYMGIELASPVVVGACSLSKYVERIKEAEEKGAGALVVKSLFEEQIALENQEFEEALNVGADYYQEASSYFPAMKHAGPEQHLFWLEKARAATKMPLIASLNASRSGTWIDWAKRMEETGVDGLELNVFTLGNRADRSAAEVENEFLELVETVCDKVRVPVSVKLAPYLTSVANIADKLDKLGVGALVLFNRFSHPEIDIATEKVVHKMRFSTPEEAALTMRWVGLLHGQLRADLIANTGIHSANEAAAMLLAGASAVQVSSVLYTKGLDAIAEINTGLNNWMDEKGYKTLKAFRGKLAQTNLSDPYAYERAQYIKLLLGFDPDPHDDGSPSAASPSPRGSST